MSDTDDERPLMMPESDDDIRPLITYDDIHQVEVFSELTEQYIDTDPEFEQVNIENWICLCVFN